MNLQDGGRESNRPAVELFFSPDRLFEDSECYFCSLLREESEGEGMDLGRWILIVMGDLSWAGAWFSVLVKL